jgi:hypothetical protein
LLLFSWLPLGIISSSFIVIDLTISIIFLGGNRHW